MTTNLRDAYTDIMSMFSNALPPQQGARKKPCNASSSVAKSGFATAAHAEPAAFEIYQEDEDHSPLGSPTDLGFSGPIAQQPSAFQQGTRAHAALTARTLFLRVSRSHPYACPFHHRHVCRRRGVCAGGPAAML
jgi:hypothetical protein